MKKISSRATFVYKTFVPVMACGLVAIVWFIALFADVPAGGRWFVMIAPIFLIFPLYGMRKKMFWTFLDEVYDCGDSLLVRDGGKEERIQLSNVISVRLSEIRPRRITLRLDKPSRFGKEVTFTPEIPLSSPFEARKLTQDLTDRADRARRTKVKP